MNESQSDCADWKSTVSYIYNSRKCKLMDSDRKQMSVCLGDGIGRSGRLQSGMI